MTPDEIRAAGLGVRIDGPLPEPPRRGLYVTGPRLAAEVEDRWKARDVLAWQQTVRSLEQLADTQGKVRFWRGMALVAGVACIILGIAVAHLLSSRGS